MSIIYKTTNLINGKFYVGQHFTSADDGYLGSGLKLRNAIKKYGKENFIREILEYCTSANVHEREIYWISELSVTDKNIGYNISNGGTGGDTFTNNPNLNQIKEKIKKNHADLSGKNHPLYGKKHSNISKMKMSISSKGKTPWNKGLTKNDDCRIKSLHKNDEWKNKIGNAVSGNKNGMFGKNKYVYYVNNIEIQSIKLFCKENNLNYNGVMGLFYSNRNGYLYKKHWFIERRLKNV